MGVREKIRLFWEFMKALFGYEEEELSELDLKELMEQDVISAMIDEFKEIAPSAADVLIHERDAYIAQRILNESAKGTVVAVVGAGHLTGVKQNLEQKELKVNLQELEQIPKKRVSIAKIAAVLVPIIFAAVILWLLFTRGPDAWSRIGDIFLIWFVVHGALSALGATIARGHPLSILTAFVAAPFTSLEPFFAPGWFAGLVEVKFRMPLVKDFQNLGRIESMRDFFNNKVIRLLMVVALANLGSIIGTIVALPWILSLGLGG
jgi:pheromone shutdown-related protein TraB